MNENLFLFLNSFVHRTEWLDQTILFTAKYLGWVLIAVLCTYMLTHKDGPREGMRHFFTMLLAAFLAWGVAVFLKELFPNPRPIVVFPDAHVLFDEPVLEAFPSGHATFFASIATSLFLYHRAIGAVYFLAALLIGAARIAAGVHFPADVLLGILLGSIIGFFSYEIFHLARRGTGRLLGKKKLDNKH